VDDCWANYLTKLEGVKKKEKNTAPGWDLLFHQFLHLCDKNKDRVSYYKGLKKMGQTHHIMKEMFLRSPYLDNSF
jgi:hypothetical protein